VRPFIFMPTWREAIEIARQLPQVKVSTWYGTPGLKVAGKGFARLRTEAEGGLVLMCSLEEKERLLESGEPAYYTTPHYDGYGSIIVNLSKIDRDALRELIVQSWRIKATPKLRGHLQARTRSPQSQVASLQVEGPSHKPRVAGPKSRVAGSTGTRPRRRS
jgi:hypothetical protein